MKTGKSNKTIGKRSNPVQSKSNNQAREGTILQAYKKGTAQLASAEEEKEPVQGKFDTAQLAAAEEETEPVQMQALAEAKYAKMQKKHGGGKAHGRRANQPASVIEEQKEASLAEIKERLLQNQANTELNAVQLKNNSTL